MRGNVRFRRILHTFVVAMTIFGSVGVAPFTAQVALATVTPTVTSLINYANNRALASSVPAAAIKLVIAVDAGEVLNSITVTATDSGASGFTTADLATLDAASEVASGVALYDDAGDTAGSFDGTDVVVPMDTVSAWSNGSTTLTLTTPGAAGTYYLVYRTSAGAVNDHAFTFTVPADGIVTDSGSPTITPVVTSAITIDTVAPTVSSTAPMTASTNVPINTFLHMQFNEQMDGSTFTPDNITLTQGVTPVGVSIKPFPDGFDVTVSSAPTYTASSRFAQLSTGGSGFFPAFGAGSFVPNGTYTTPSAGDIVLFQRDTFPPELGVVTNATLTGGTFAVNGFPLFGGQQLTKIASATETGLAGSSTALIVGQLVVANSSDRYAWHMVTAGTTVDDEALRFDGDEAVPSLVSGSRVSSMAMDATATDNGVTGGGTLAVSQGDLVFVQLAGGSYGWHLVTTAGGLSSVEGFGESTAVLDGTDAASSLVEDSSQMSKLTPAAQGLATDEVTAFTFGDMLFASTTANAANNGSYAFHMVTSPATGVSHTALRLDNSSSPLTISSSYTLTATTSVTDLAGNALASNAVVTFSTGAVSGTNTTPPFVQSSIPQGGNQQFPPNGVVKITFSVDMSVSGGSSGTNSVTNPANVGLFLDNYGAPGAAVSATNTYDSATKTVTITPASALAVNTGYVAKVLSSAYSTTDTPSADFFLSFRTAGAVDATAPTVLGTSPTNSATGVSRSSSISIGFSKDIDPSTITTSTIKLQKTSDDSYITGAVTYNPGSRSANFTPAAQLLGSTEYRIRALAGSSGVKSVAGLQLGAATPANDYTSTFTTNNTTDSTAPKVTFSGADNFGVAITFSEQVKSGGGPNAADNIANYALESPVGTSASLSGKTVTYDGETKTANITGLALQNSSTFKVTVTPAVQDLANNSIDTTGTPPNNVAYGTVQDSDTTGGQLGPGNGPAMDPGMQGMNPTRVTPMVRSAGATSNYKLEFLATTSIPVLGQIVLTFPAGFDVTNVGKATAGTASFCNSDINGPMTGTVTLGAVAGDADAGTVTINTAGAATSANAFVCVDLTGIVNSTVPSSSGYTVGVSTRDTADNYRSILESKTSSPFFLGATGSRTLTVNVFKDANTDGNNDAGEGINDVTAFLFSPATGGKEATTANDVVDGVATFSNLADGDYMVGIKPNTNIDVAFNSAPQPIIISANTVKNFALSSAAAITISGTVTGTNGTIIDVFASSPNGFTKKTITLSGGADAYSLPVSANETYNVGVGPSVPEQFMTPGAPPSPPPDFTFMPPANVQVNVASASVTEETVTGLAFTLTTANKTITGFVLDSNGTGVSTANIFCRPVAASTTGMADGFGTGTQTTTTGTFTVNVTQGVYLCGVFKPGMPPVPDKQITVGAASNTPSSLTFRLSAGTTSLTISGTIKDDAGNAIPYAGVSGRKVTSSADTTAVGGDSSNFVGGPTDANGAYTLYVSAGTWVVEAFAPGFGRLGTKTIVISSSNATGQDFSAETLSMGSIRGTVTKGGTAQQGVMVRAETADGTSGNMTITATDGTYTVKVPAGTYTVKCFFPGVGEGTPLTSVAVAADTTTSGQDCTLGAPITLTINVTDGTNPVTNAGVDVRDSNGRGNFTNVSTTSGANAVYTVNVPPGTYTVRVGHPAYGKIGETTGVNTTRTITHTAAAGAIFAVTGTVTGDGSNLSGAWVSLTGAATGTTNVIALGSQTASNGTFSVSVPAGIYNLRVDKPGYRSPAESAVAVTAATAVGTIALTTASKTITGTISISGSGVSNAFVDANDGLGGYSVAQTDSAGAYSLAVDTGTWSVRAHAPGYEGGPMSVIVGGSSVSSQDMSLTAIPNFVVKPERPETVTPTSGGFFTNSDIGDNFKLNIPANALGTGSNAATVTTKINTAMPTPPRGSILSKNAVTITAVDSSGQKLSSLNDSVTIVIPYDEADIPAGSSEANLVIGTWNDATQAYDTLTTTVDTDNNTLTATVAHFSDFAPLMPADGAPSTPTGLTVTDAGTGSTARLTWTAVDGASTYNIYQSTDNSSFPLLASPTTTSYTATGLSASTTYYYKVSAVNASDQESAASSASSVTIAAAASSSGGVIVSGPSSSSSSTATTSTTTDTTTTDNTTTTENTVTTDTTVTTSPTLSVADARAQQVAKIKAEAEKVKMNDVATLASDVGQKRDIGMEKKYESTIVARVVSSLTPAATKAQVLNFVTYGTPTTVVLGAGERAGVVNSFEAAFGYVPTSSGDWEDVIKIANGRWPGTLNAKREKAVIGSFKKVYLRDADLSNPHDQAAIAVMAYGLRSDKRNLKSEAAAIKSFRAIYKKVPVSAAEWDVVRAIAYSGAIR
ncbi:MAG: Ig-like domain-containing protein [bacterium]|nr:Ig-like domain-containing protein [bacterium]